MGDTFDDHVPRSPKRNSAGSIPSRLEDPDRLPLLVSGHSQQERAMQRMLRLPKWPFKFDFFLSYTAREQGSEIRPYVTLFVRTLREMGHSVLWLDEVEIGKFRGSDAALKQALSRGLDESLAVLLFTSPRYWQSEYCRFEFERALLTGPHSDGPSTVPFVGAISWHGGHFLREEFFPCNEHWNAVGAWPQFLKSSWLEQFRQNHRDELGVKWLWRLRYPLVEFGALSGEYFGELSRMEKERRYLPTEEFVEANKVLFSRALILLAHCKRHRWAKWRSLVSSRWGMSGLKVTHT